MNALQNLVTQAAQFLVGPFGISFIIVAVCIAFLASMVGMAPRAAGPLAMLFGAAALSAAFFVNTFLGGGGF
jgi:Na+-translocating ferredoxin:NAD+ oxidoreductase RnfD subunit